MIWGSEKHTRTHPNFGNTGPEKCAHEKHLPAPNGARSPLPAPAPYLMPVAGSSGAVATGGSAPGPPAPARLLRRLPTLKAAATGSSS